MATDISFRRPFLIIEADEDEGRFVRVRLAPSRVDGEHGVFVREAAGPDALRVNVVSDEQVDGALPSMVGSCVLEGDAIRFMPIIPFVLGVRYRATIDIRALDAPEGTTPLHADFELPRGRSGPPPVVTAIYPTATSLPENVLRFYVEFSEPMRRGAACMAVRFLDVDGEPVPDALYRAPAELWDPGMRRLTVLVDPGRLKRGLGPNRALGPPLAPERDYQLEIGAAMTAIDGQPLSEAVTRRFRTTEARRVPLAVRDWAVQVPPAVGVAPLVVRFPVPMDQALLAGALRLLGPGDCVVAGSVLLGAGDVQWCFIPSEPWSSGRYRLEVASGIEDVCGNDLSGAFERAVGLPTLSGKGMYGDCLDFEVN